MQQNLCCAKTSMPTVAHVFVSACVSGDMKLKRCSHNVLSSLYDQVLITAAEMSLPDAGDKMLAGHPPITRDGDVLPISRHPCRLTDIKLKRHPCTHINKWKKKHLTAWFSVPRSQVNWVASARGVAQRDVLIVYSMRVIVTPTPLLSVHQVEHSPLCPPPTHLPGNRR